MLKQFHFSAAIRALADPPEQLHYLWLSTSAENANSTLMLKLLKKPETVCFLRWE